MAKTVYKKKTINGKEYYFYRLRHKNLKKPKDIYSTTVKELDAKIKAAVNDLDNGISGNKEYFGVFLKDWLYNARMLNKKPSTKVRYDGIYRNYIENSPIFDIKLKDLSPADVQEYYKNLLTSGKSAAAINNLHKLIAPCIRYAYDNNRIIKDFSRAIVLPKDDEKKKLKGEADVKPLSLEEQFKFIEAIKGHELEALFIAALDTGLRQGELFALTWKDIDFKSMTIKVCKSYKDVKDIESGEHEGVIQTPKTDKGFRSVPIPDHLKPVLDQHKTAQKIIRIKLGSLYENNNLVFSNNFGKYHDSSNVLKRFKTIIKSIGIQDRTFHQLRHTYATRLFELGENPKTVQVLLGHSNVATTLDTYTHVLEGMKETAVSKLNSLYTSPTRVK